MKKDTTKKVKMDDDCGGLKPYNPVKPPKNKNEVKENEQKKLEYVEPANYFPKSLRKKYKIGEFAEPKTDEKEKASANSKKK